MAPRGCRLPALAQQALGWRPGPAAPGCWPAGGAGRSVCNRKECRKGAGRPAREQLRKLAPKSCCAGAVQDGVRNILHMASALRSAMRAQAVAALQPQPAARLLSQPVGAAASMPAASSAVGWPPEHDKDSWGRGGERAAAAVGSEATPTGSADIMERRGGPAATTGRRTLAYWVTLMHALYRGLFFYTEFSSRKIYLARSHPRWFILFYSFYQPRSTFPLPLGISETFLQVTCSTLKRRL